MIFAQIADTAAEVTDKLLDKEPTTILVNSLGDMLRDAIAHLPNILVAVAVVVLTAVVSWVVSKIAHFVLEKRKMRTSLKDLIYTLTKFFIWLLGLVIAAMILFPGLTPSKALGAAGLASVAVGFAFKDIFQNFFAGILILWKFPFEPGDFIVCGDVKGKVEDTELRLTTIRQTDGELVIVPNALLFSNPINVLTSQPLRRLKVAAGIGYDEDIKMAVPIIKEAVESCELVDKSRDRKVLVSGFGASSIDIDILVWVNSSPMGQREAADQVITAVKAALDEAGIEIPFPYRTLTFSEPLEIKQST